MAHKNGGGVANVPSGTIELIGQEAIVPRNAELPIPDAKIDQQIVWDQQDDAEIEDVATAVKDARIVIMNPPFTRRVKMGEKFSKPIQLALRQSVDCMENHLIRNDQQLTRFVDKRSIAPLFVALADKIVSRSDGVLTMIHPTIALCNPSGLHERILLAHRYHVHTVLTCHQPGNINMSQNTNINESIVVMKRHIGPKPPTRFINLDRMPTDEIEIQDFHKSLSRCRKGLIPNGWGEVSEWTAEQIERGDWTLAVWRSSELAEAAAKFADHPNLHNILDIGLRSLSTREQLSGSYKPATTEQPGSFLILKSKGADAQKKIRGQPDEYWIHKKYNQLETENILNKANHLLVTAGQDTSTARLTAVASEEKYVGFGWHPVSGLSTEEAKALAVFINSTPGRLQLMRRPGKKLNFPNYNPHEVHNLRIPDIKDQRIRTILAKCWEDTKEMIVPQFRDGECEVRRLWDEAVAKAMSWDPQRLAHLRNLLNNEPHVRGLGYNEYADETTEDDETA